jgi:hypothetical protein
MATWLLLSKQMPHVSSSAVIDDKLRTLPLPNGLAGTGTSPQLLLAPGSTAAAAAAAGFAAEDNAEPADNALARDAALLLASLLLQQVLGHTSAAAAVETAGASMSGSC